MDAAFDHIEQARYLLARIFESGFSSCGNVSDEIKDLEHHAKELALDGGAGLLARLGIELAALRAGQASAADAALAYSNLLTYYQMVSDTLILEGSISWNNC